MAVPAVISISPKIGRVGIVYWRDPAMAENALSEDDYNRLQVREFCCRKATMGLIRRDKRGDYVVAGEVSLTGRDVEFEQVTVVPRSLVFQVSWMEGKCGRKRRNRSQQNNFSLARSAATARARVATT